MASNLLEKTLNEINSQEVKMADMEIKRNNARLLEFRDVFIEALKKDVFFDAIFERCFFGGSFYDGLKVGKPNEFDIDLLFSLPKLAGATIIADDNNPGFVQVKLPDLKQLIKNQYPPSYADMQKLVNDDNYLVVDKIMKWFQSRVDKVKVEMNSMDLNFTIEKTIVMNRGPAVTFTIRDNKTKEHFDVDFVPCFKFSHSQWPENYNIFNDFDPNDQLTKEFLVVPKPKDAFSNTYFRLSFQGQEKRLIEDIGHLKPAIRLLKLYRDKYNDHKIKSYFLKTVALWALEDSSFRYKRETLSSIFLQLLDRLIIMVRNEKLNYYWKDSFNLISDCPSQYLRDLLYRLVNHKKVFESGNSDKIKAIFKVKTTAGLATDDLAAGFKGLGINNPGQGLQVKQGQDWGPTIAAVGTTAAVVIGGIWGFLKYNANRQD